MLITVCELCLLTVSTATCPALSPPINGGVTVVSLTVSSIATYTCTTGYVLTPSTGSPRVCQADGQWTGVAPTCPRELAMVACMTVVYCCYCLLRQLSTVELYTLLME